MQQPPNMVFLLLLTLDQGYRNCPPEKQPLLLRACRLRPCVGLVLISLSSASSPDVAACFPRSLSVYGPLVLGSVLLEVRPEFSRGNFMNVLFLR